MRLPAPPGPFRPEAWRSPLRGPWLTAMLGWTLLVCLLLVSITGFLSHSAYLPELGRNAIVPVDRDLPTVGWTTRPSWLYAFTQGIHVNVGLATVPILLAKLWSVIPRLFVWPPVSSPAQGIERAAVALLVGSAIFLFATGIANMQYWYVFGFDFVLAHYYASVVFVAALAVHLVAKVPVARRALRDRGGLAPLRESLAETRPEPPDPHGGLAPAHPDPPSMTRRGLLALVGGGSLLVLLGNVGESIGGPLRRLAFFAPRRGDIGDGPNDFQVNKTARAAGVTPERTGVDYRLVLAGGDQEVSLSREDLLALPQRSATLPIACVEGWSVTREWTGVPISALAELAGVSGATQARVESLQERGRFRQVTLSSEQVADADALLALKVEGADLSPDHGFPARIIVPAMPGVHNTKWVARMEFRA